RSRRTAAATCCRVDRRSATAAAQGLKVRRLSAGGSWMRTLGPRARRAFVELSDSAAEGRRRPCRRARSKRVELVGTQADRRRGEILLEVRYRGGPENWQHSRGTQQQPGESNLARRSTVAPDDPNEPRVRGSEPACGQRVPRDKGDTGTGAYIN